MKTKYAVMPLLSLFALHTARGQSRGDPGCQPFTYTEFSSASIGSSLQINGSAAAPAAPVGPETAPVLRLTPAQMWQSGSAFRKDSIQLRNNASFSTAFALRMGDGGGASDGTSNPLGADGIVFVLNTVANNVGGNGGGVGYAGINNSVGIKFDTWADAVANGYPGNSDPDGNFVAVYENGSTQTAGYSPYWPTNPSTEPQYYSPVTSMKNGHIWYAWIDYNGQTQELEVRLSDGVNTRPASPQLGQTIDLSDPSILGSFPAVYAGFTSGTGGAYDNNDILSWQFNDTYQPISQVGAPVVTQQPISVITNQGATVAFSVTATGTTPLAYHWNFNGAGIAGTTDSTLILTNVRPADAGFYSVVVTNVAGWAASSNALLTVLLPPDVSLIQPTNGAVFPEGANIAISADASDVDATIVAVAFYEGVTNQSVTNLLRIATNAPYGIVWNNVGVGDYALTAQATDDAGLVSTSTVVAISVVPVNHAPSFQKGPDITVDENCGPQTVGRWATAISAGPPDEAGQHLTFILTNDNPALFSTPPSLTTHGTLAFTPATNATGMATVTVLLKDDGGTANGGQDTSPPQSFTITVLTVDLPPIITQQPLSVITNQGATVAFSVAATGTPPLSYQWTCNGMGIPNATDTTLLLPSVQLANAGAYSVVVTNQAGAVTSATATLTVLTPPSVWLIQPPDGAAFQAGGNVTIQAGATNASGTVSLVEFFQGGTNLLGIATDPPYGIVWSNVPAGNYSLTAVALGSGGVSPPSRAVLISVTNPAPPGLAITIVKPANFAGFCPGQNIEISALPANLTSAASVEFFAGDSSLGTVVASPNSYTSYTWTNPPEGGYLLTARITDSLGQSAISPAVPVAVSQDCGEIAIIQAAPDPEIGQLQEYLYGMDLGSHVFDQAGLDAQAFNPYSYRAVIWDDVGQGATALAPGTVDALAGAYSNGIPLYLIGDYLASAAASLSETQQCATWMGLTHLSLATGRGGDGTVAMQSSNSTDKILHGPFATVTSFAYPGAVDLATNTDADTQVMGTDGGADVLLAYPSEEVINPGETTRRFTQQVRVVPPGASADAINQLRGLFQNVVYWLLGGKCTDGTADLTLSAQPDPAQVPAQVGQPLKYQLVVAPGVGCDRTGVLVSNVLPVGVQFLSASSEQGTWAYDASNRVVNFYLGLVPNASSPLLTVTVVPVEPGTITDAAGVRLDNAIQGLVYFVTNMTEVQPGPDLTPRLSIARVQPGVYELRLSGAANVQYEIRASSDLKKTGTSVTTVLGPEWTLIFAPSEAGTGASLFYEARVAPSGD